MNHPSSIKRTRRFEQSFSLWRDAGFAWRICSRLVCAHGSGPGGVPVEQFLLPFDGQVGEGLK